ncbi:MAG: hypothetical protein WBV06_20345 [Acidimicrobiia bacterium]
MNREIKPILAIVASAAVLVLVGLAFLGGSTKTTILPTVELPPPGDVGPTGAPIAVVISTHQDQETSFFGLLRGPKHYIAGVQFYAQSGCLRLLADGDPWPASAAECSTDVPISGVVRGLGVAATGETIVLVDVEVSEECFVALDPGNTWPPDLTTCAYLAGVNDL